MALQIFAIRDRPHDFAVTKADVALAECVFRLDFGRPLVHVRMLLVGPLRTLCQATPGFDPRATFGIDPLV